MLDSIEASHSELATADTAAKDELLSKLEADLKATKELLQEDIRSKLDAEVGLWEILLASLPISGDSVSMDAQCQ